MLRKKNFNKLVATKKAIGPLSSFNYSTTLNVASEEERNEFLAVYPDLVRNLTKYASKFQSRDAAKLYEKALLYNVATGKYNLGVNMVPVFRMVADESQLTSENIKLAQLMGWCVEMLITGTIMLDDIQDGSVTRRGKPSWYMLDEVGLIAINDSLMILHGIYHILEENFAQKDYYVKLLELFHEVIFGIMIGQSMDLHVSKGDVTSFTMDKYKSIVENKACIAFYLPMALLMHLCDFTDPEIFRQTRAIIYELGSYFQIDNDVDDCFGDIEKTGKFGTDIEENKCTWLSVVCMERASEAQKEIMRECYGKTDPVKVAQVKRLYEELELPKIFNAYKQETINILKTRIQQNSGTIPEHLYRIALPFLTIKKWSKAFESFYTSA